MDSLFLRNMRRTALRTLRIVEGMSQAGFLDDLGAQDAVAKNLTILAETREKLTENPLEFLDMPWKIMRDARDDNTFNTFGWGADWEAIWRIIHADLPRLIEALGPYAGPGEDCPPLSRILEERRQGLLELMKRYPMFSNLRVFGSVARGEDTPKSDFDFAVDALPDAGFVDREDLREALEEFLGTPVHVVMANDHRKGLMKTNLDRDAVRL